MHPMGNQAGNSCGEDDRVPSPGLPLPPRRNIKLVIAYDGSAYHGWQRQAEGIDTIQLRIEQAARDVVRHRVVAFGAGRTDAGVHAAGQTANFRTTSFAVPLEGLRRAMNSRLPDDIVVVSAAQVDESFHASRSAIGKTYRYRICTGALRPVERARQTYHYWRPLDIEAMREAARRFVGRHDFRGLATSSDEREDTIRTVRACNVAPAADEIHITVEGDGFLYNMVRNIVGTLVEIGRGHWPIERVDLILASCDRTLAGPTAPAAGLILMTVHYPPGV